MPASAEVQFARLLRPFPARRLDAALYHVLADAGAIAGQLRRSLVDPPVTVEDWQARMFELETLLESLRDRCSDALPKLRRLSDEAPRAFEVTVAAAANMLAGLRVSDTSPALAPVAPEPALDPVDAVSERKPAANHG